ncbi:HK97 gp10 family phage protein [Xylocopilactobacillus apis]|uniref:PH domain-containing protein n=1 Tax=Xylocopilactobacillus apis TaxID=2932183 RepID=A0AAU9DAZ5_9LACO|nr:HK97 gp10 family phage protein [Xylocopilactobacillus apis]BDR56880.1 hypothetical protein KIMC2_14420 [Xylocopilactobacillus apis]
MADLSKELNDWLNSLQKHVNVTHEEKAEITGAGAKVYAEYLKKNTPVSSVNYSKGKQAGHASEKKKAHMRDMITYEPGLDAEKEKTGNTNVGYDGKYFNFVAMITNNGKRKMSAKEEANLHFVERSRKESEKAVQSAMEKKYREIKGN